MSITCSYCHATPTQVRVGGASFHICPQCHATFLAAPMMAAIRRDIDHESRQCWHDVLVTSAQKFTFPAWPLVCAEHGNPLQEGELPEVSLKGHYATCCNLLHLTPDQLRQILARGLTGDKRVSFNDLTKSQKKEGFIRRMLLHFMPAEDNVNELDGIIWATRLRPILAP